ncbi:S8 family serine peptidase [Carboxylicivirga mesophila]|uniref:S8 family serine peptidase n=1 Tax=Carboxylicivirga mesophila TaxID=1166478 RepID=A0ABS5KFK9_9BACT|nr:S8 family serine peptidase [Carboxylicivirga mesophila]MBS2213694.1 S8 family serine peptidase [Carboxylicivirga mesophila]
MRTVVLFVLILIHIRPFGLLAQDKIVINKAEDLPRHSYELIVDDALIFIQDDQKVLDLAQLIKTDLLNDLDTYEINDNASLRSIYTKLRDIALIENDYKTVIEYIKRERTYSDKESAKLIRAKSMEAIANAMLTNEAKDLEACEKSINLFLNDFFQTINFEVVQEDVEEFKGILEIWSKNIAIAPLKGTVQTALNKNKGNVPQEIAFALIGAYADLNYFFPYKDIIYTNYTSNLEKYGTKAVMADIWTDRNVSLNGSANNHSVTIGIWDTGVDMNAMPENKRWTNTNEKTDNIDNDNNGFIDDVYGIAYDLNGEKSTSILHSQGHNTANKEQSKASLKGLMDIFANISSDEAIALKKEFSSVPPEEFEAYFEQLILYSNYAHGTHVAGIAVDGNPAAKVLSARLTFDHKLMPEMPSEEKTLNWAQMYTETIQYFKTNNVRVVNMSWGIDLNQEFIEPLEMHGYGESDEERKTYGQKLFEIQRKAFMEAVASNPDILFICAAGNSNNDVDFTADFPSSLNYPNLITVGAVDKAGNKTSFTTEGKSVDVYANGYEVESVVPGGDVIAFSGTSMASPQVTNLAAKMLSINPKLSPPEVIDIITSTSSTSEEGIKLIHPKHAIDKARECNVFPLPEMP